MIFNKYQLKLLQNIARVKFKLPGRLISSLNLWNEDLSSDIKRKIEDHWRVELKSDNYNENTSDKEKYYVLSMFPYPSGSLHMGHVRVYTISDTIARFQRMNGKNVIHPIGWDAFGLPAENAAIERQVAPDEWTAKNISHMKQQLQKLGCSFEWDRELTTCGPEYYKWTQDLFLKLYDSGLVYQKEEIVNWDPVDKTVLADEQVDENGCSWRSGAKVERKPLRQWFVKTTNYAKDLLDGLDDSVLKDWRDVIKLQKHWIGDCNGVNFDFQIDDSLNEFLTLWTPHPEFMKHSKFVVISSKHILAKKETDNIKNDVRRLKIQAINPLSSERIPIFVTDRIEFPPMADSLLGIPGICEDAANFALEMSIPYKKLPEDLPSVDKLLLQDEICTEAKKLQVGGFWTSSKLRDWLISRQRFWGTPIPIIHCDNCGVVPVPTQDLPVKLPKISQLSLKGSSQLSQCEDWVNVDCPKCGKPAKRETDTMDTFVDSSWYYLRYLDPKNSKEMFDKEKSKSKLPVDLYIGGKEHAVLHLYYARFISHFLHSLGLVPEREPFKRLLVQGMVMGRSFRVKETGEYVSEKKVKITNSKKNQAELLENNRPVVMAWEKMSKSKHNGVDPEEMFKEYGTDTTRLLILADVAPTSHRNWNSDTFPGIVNWQKRLWLTVREFIDYRTKPPEILPESELKTFDESMFDSRNFYVKGVTFNYCGSQQHSVAISKQQGLTNSLRRVPGDVFAKSPQFERALASQIILLAPMAPLFASELWAGFLSAPNRLNNSGEIDWEKSVLEQKWPEIDSDYKLDLVIVVNGFETAIVKIPRCDLEKLPREETIRIALEHQEVQEEIGKFNILKTNYVMHPGYEGIVGIKTDAKLGKKEQKEKKKRAIKTYA